MRSGAIASVCCATRNSNCVSSRGYSFQQEVLFRCYKSGAKLGEYPILFENRRAGASKVNRKSNT